MGDISIIARRLSDGHVQYGWSGNGGYFSNVGVRLLMWYQEPENVEYLFELGQTCLIGKVGSERGGFRLMESHSPTGEAFWLGNTERQIFSKIAFIDYGYFYDLDCKWYYIIPGPFRVKIPLELIAHHIDDERGSEFNYLFHVQERILNYIFNEYIDLDSDFKILLDESDLEAKIVLDTIYQKGQHVLYYLYDEYKTVYEYFDDWIVVKANSDYTEIQEIVIKKKGNKHIETCEW